MRDRILHRLLGCGNCGGVPVVAASVTRHPRGPQKHDALPVDGSGQIDDEALGLQLRHQLQIDPVDFAVSFSSSTASSWR